MNKKLLYIAVAAFGATALGSCDNEMALPPIAEPESEWVGLENSTVQQIKEQYWQSSLNYNTPVNLTTDDPDTGEEVIVKGRVISSDATSNLYNNIVVRGDDGYAMTIAARPASSKKLADQYPYGAEVYVNLSGICVGRFAGLFQVGAASGTEITFLTNEVLTQHVQANSIGYPSKVDTMSVDIATLSAAKNDVAQLQYYMSQLIRVDGVTFENAGQPFAGGTKFENRYVKDANGGRINVRCNNRATWSKEIIPGGTGAVVGILSYFNNDWQIMPNDAQGFIGFDPAGEAPEPAPGVDPAGDGTLASPYNVAKALEVTNALAADATTATEFYVKGIITSIDEIDTGTYGNATYSIADVENGTAFKIFHGYWLGGAKFTAADQLQAGKEVVVLGKLLNYKGNTPEMAQGNKIVSYDGQTSVTPDPAPGDEPAGEGTLASPYNVAKALEVAKALVADATTDSEIYIKGKISAIKEIETATYGNATYSIVDKDGAEAITVYRGYWFDGAKFTAADQLQTGKEVVVLGKLINFKGNTPQVAQGSKIVSYDGQTSGGTVTPDPEPEPDPEPGPAPDLGEGVAITVGDMPHANGDATGDVTGALTQNGYTITTDKGSGATAPAINVYNGVGTLRVYANNTVNIKGAAMGKIVFTLNTSTGARRYTAFTPSTGKLDPAQASGDASITWTGNSGDVTFTVGATTTLGTESGKPGQVHISAIEIYPVK